MVTWRKPLAVHDRDFVIVLVLGVVDYAIYSGSLYIITGLVGCRVNLVIVRHATIIAYLSILSSGEAAPSRSLQHRCFLFQQSRCLDLPFAAKTFDVVICRNLLHNMQAAHNLKALLRNIRREPMHLAGRDRNSPESTNEYPEDAAPRLLPNVASGRRSTFFAQH